MANFVSQFFTNVKNHVKTSFDKAPPGVRNNYDTTYIRLYRKQADGSRVFVGSFAPELYDLANASMLRAQILEKECRKRASDAGQSSDTFQMAGTLKEGQEILDSLYVRLPSGEFRRKTAFELALIPEYDLIAVENYILWEFEFLRDRQLPLPPMQTKFTVGSYLQRMQEAGLESENPGDLVGISVKLNIDNPVATRTFREKLFHYSAEWAVLLLTACTALTVAIIDLSLGLTSPAFLLTVLGAAYVANESGNRFATFDMAEELNRTFGFIFNKDLALGKKLDWKKAAMTVLYLSAIVAFSGYAAYGIGATVLNLPVANLVALGIPTALVSASITFAASVAATSVALIALTGKLFTVRYFKGMSPWDNQIDFSDPVLKQAVQELPELADRSPARRVFARPSKSYLDLALEKGKSMIFSGQRFPVPEQSKAGNDPAASDELQKNQKLRML